MLLTEDREHRWWYAMDSASHSFVLSMLLSSLSAPTPSSSSSSSISLLNLPWFCFVSIYMSLMFSLVCKRRASNISYNGKGGLDSRSDFSVCIRIIFVPWLYITKIANYQWLIDRIRGIVLFISLSFFLLFFFHVSY